MNMPYTAVEMQICHPERAYFACPHVHVTCDLSHCLASHLREVDDQTVIVFSCFVCNFRRHVVEFTPSCISKIQTSIRITHVSFHGMTNDTIHTKLRYCLLPDERLYRYCCFFILFRLYKFRQQQQTCQSFINFNQSHIDWMLFIIQYIIDKKSLIILNTLEVC